MKEITINRIKLLWIRLFALRKKQLLFYFLGMAAIMLMYNCFTVGTGRDADSETMMALYYVIFCACMSLNMASAFRSMQTREGRIEFLMLPAGRAEKFIAASLWALLTSVILFAAAVLVNDVIRLLLLAGSGALANWHDQTFTGILPQCLDMTGITVNSTHIVGLPAILSWHLAGFSLYLLGACIWYKRVFLKTIIAFAVCNFLIILMMTGVVEILPDDSPLYNALRHYDFEAFLPYGNTLFTIFNLLVTCALWWIGYSLFKRREVVSQRINWLGLFKK